MGVADTREDSQRAAVPAGAAARRAPRPVSPALRWLRERLLPGGADVLMVAAYAMILIALVIFILQPPARAAVGSWRFYATVGALAALLALHVLIADIEAWLGGRWTFWAHLLASGALFLAANWFGLGGDVSFLPYLLFMLTAEAFSNLRAGRALLYSVGLALAWHGLIWLHTRDAGLVATNALTVGAGMLFAAIFSHVVLLHSNQTQRAEALLGELRAANAELSLAREREQGLAVAEERVRLTRDIHDGLGHHLTVLNVQLQVAEKLVARDPARAGATIALCREEAQAALEEVRRSVAAMRRTPLDGRALDEAVAALVRDFDRHAPLIARFARHGEPVALPPAAEMTLYRAAQEGLTNAQKHAGAGSVTVELRFAAAAVSLAVRDDGSGRGGGDVGGGFGLAGLRERAEQLGGALSAGPIPGGGFRLELSVPVGAGERSATSGQRSAVSGQPAMRAVEGER